MYFPFCSRFPPAKTSAFPKTSHQTHGGALSPASMAAALLRNGLFNSQCNRHSLYFYSWKTSLNCSISDQAAVQNYTFNRLRQPTRFSRFKHNFRKSKGMEFSSPSTTSSSSQKFRLVRWYLYVLKSRPIATKSITAALIYSAADITSQTVVGEMGQYELVRTLRMAGYGMLILGPSLHYWYNFMSRVFPKRDFMSTLKKIVLGQAVYGPAMTAVFFSVNAALQGETGLEIVARLKRDLLPTMINGVMYWPVCDFVTFKFIPVHLQPLVVNSFSYLWTVYMTYMASLEKVGAS